MYLEGVNMLDDIKLLLGSGADQYPFLTTFVCCLLFCFLINIAYSIIADIFKKVGGFSWIIFFYQIHFFMKKFFEIMGKDILSEEFTRKEYIVYGIVAPLALVAALVFISMIDMLCYVWPAGWWIVWPWLPAQAAIQLFTREAIALRMFEPKKSIL